jgi:hypothetical protein
MISKRKRSREKSDALISVEGLKVIELNVRESLEKDNRKFSVGIILDVLAEAGFNDILIEIGKTKVVGKTFTEFVDKN